MMRPQTADELARCPWANATAPEIAYHDREWGVPLHDEACLFELLTLEGAQAGLRWSTILARREGYRRAFANFDPSVVAQLSPAKVDELVLDEGIIRHRGKIESTLNNARAIRALEPEFSSFNEYVWSFTDQEPLQPRYVNMEELPGSTDLSKAMSRDMKRRGFRFVGPTTVYAFMQAAGITNDHLRACFRQVQLDPGQ